MNTGHANFISGQKLVDTPPEMPAEQAAVHWVEHNTLPARARMLHRDLRDNDYLNAWLAVAFLNGARWAARREGTE